MKKFKKIIIFLIVILAMTILIIYSDDIKQGVINGLIMCGNVIIPSLFPFAVLSTFLINSGLIFELNKPINKLTKILFKMNSNEFCIFILSLLGGYPIGTTLVNHSVENKIISEKRANKFYLFCFGAGPSFIIVAIGEGIFNSKTVGLFILFSQIVASFIISSMLLKRSENISCDNNQILTKNFSDTFVDATYQSSISMFKICTYVVLFSAIINVFKKKYSKYYIFSIITLLLEVTNGVFSAHKNIYIICFLISFGGICIHMQTYSLINQKKPKYVYYLMARITHGLLSCLVLKLILTVFPQSIQTISNGVSFSYKISSVSILSSLALILMSICLLFSVKSGRKNLKDML